MGNNIKHFLFITFLLLPQASMADQITHVSLSTREGLSVTFDADNKCIVSAKILFRRVDVTPPLKYFRKICEPQLGEVRIKVEASSNILDMTPMWVIEIPSFISTQSSGGEAVESNVIYSFGVTPECAKIMIVHIDDGKIRRVIDEARWDCDVKQKDRAD